TRFYSFTLALQKEGRSSTCSLGDPDISSCQIRYNGQMVQCSYAMALPKPNNIFEHGLVGAWQRLPIFKKFLDPERLEGKCGACERKKVCKGGCRALAYLQGRGEWAEDPICPHTPVLQEV
ncbi:MAG: SPASM domain-containing protein, partial [Deltaproteobacteria bacterium]|nr:SPASM domain-containing protein [Deltaproteobacteria bacterium]